MVTYCPSNGVSFLMQLNRCRWSHLHMHQPWSMSSPWVTTHSAHNTLSTATVLQHWAFSRLCPTLGSVGPLRGPNVHKNTYSRLGHPDPAVLLFTTTNRDPRGQNVTLGSQHLSNNSSHAKTSRDEVSSLQRVPCQLLIVVRRGNAPTQNLR